MGNKGYIQVSELFYSVQGEGPTTGCPSIFLRVAGCNLLCGGKGTDKDGQLHDGATWRCDTIEVWSKGTKTSFDDLAQQISELSWPKSGSPPHIILTGGEPMLIQDTLAAFIEQHLVGLYTEVETNGTIMPSKKFSALINQWNVSPKLENSGMPFDKRYHHGVLKELAALPNSYFKFVIGSEQEFAEVAAFYLDTLVPARQMVVMPAGENQAQLNVTRPIVADICKQYGLRMSDRMHVSIWDKKTGV